MCEVNNLDSLEPNSQHHLGFQFIPLDYLCLFGHKLWHIPTGTDIPPCQPCTLFRSQVDYRIAAELWGFREYFPISVGVEFFFGSIDWKHTMLQRIRYTPRTKDISPRDVTWVYREGNETLSTILLIHKLGKS